MTTLNRNRWKQNIDILTIKREMISKWKLLPVLVLKSFIQIQANWVIVSIQKCLLMDSASEKKFMLSNFLHNTLYTQNALLWTNMQRIYSKQVALGSTLCTTMLLYPSPGVHILLYTYLIEIYTFGRFFFQLLRWNRRYLEQLSNSADLVGGVFRATYITIEILPLK